jgi:hypothetical protein
MDQRKGFSVTKEPKVAVIILTWNGLEDLATCLDSFSCVEDPNYEPIVVDNGSEDDTVATVRERYAWVTLIANDCNLGYVGGNNVGIRYALQHDAEYVFILNNDTKMTADVLGKLRRIMESDPKIAIAGAKNLLMEDPSYTWGKYGRLTWGPMLVEAAGRLERDRPESVSPKDVDFVIGNGCMMRRQVLEEIGPFDEAFFQTHEDVDWAVRARRAGYRVVYVDTAVILHKGGASADPQKPVRYSYGYMLGRNAILFARKHATPLQWAKLVTLLTFGVVSRAAFQAAYFAYSALRGQKPWLSGVLDGFRHRLRPEQAIGYAPAVRSFRADTPFLRFLRWLGA